MDRILARLTIFFDDPFWTGVFEREADGKLEVSRTVFGVQPTDTQVYAYFLSHWSELHFSPPVEKGKQPVPRRRNPKRIAREVHRTLGLQGVGTKAQQALALMRQEVKTTGRNLRRQRAHQESEQKFVLRAQKKKDKHRGH